MRLNDLTDNYSLKIEPCDVRWRAIIRIYDTDGDIVDALGETPEEALENVLAVLGDMEGHPREYDGGIDEDYFNEDMDGDHESALASAGMGTDEDYGCFDGGLEDW